MQLGEKQSLLQGHQPEELGYKMANHTNDYLFAMDIDNLGPSSSSSLTSHNQLFSFDDLSLEQLLNWQQENDGQEWAQKVVDSLIKELRVLSCTQLLSKCVTIARFLDERLQVFLHKTLPLIIYYQIWPDLEDHHELEPIAACQYPYNEKKKQIICINPQHYKSIQNSLLLPPLVPSQPEFASALSLLPLRQENEPNVSCTNLGFNNNTYMNVGGPNPLNCSQMGPNHIPQIPYGSLPETPPYDQTDIKQVNTIWDPISHQQVPCWASIIYFEMNCQVGELFHCRSSSVNVNGFTNPCNNSDRFSLGQFHKAHRTSRVEYTRCHIGKGVLLNYVHGILSARCLSNSAIFVQSSNFNYVHEFHPSVVIKIPPGRSQVIFSKKRFAKLFWKSVDQRVEAGSKLKNMCTIRLSFVKGWGTFYEYQDVELLPCWIEIYFHDVMKWMEITLSQLRSHNDVNRLKQ